MINTNKLNIGDASDNGQVTIIDEDRLCYLVKSTSRGAYGLRTISKSLLSEYVEYFAKKPDASANDARDALCGNTDIDKFEYGYTSTLKTMAQMVLGQVSIISATLKSVTEPQKHPIFPLQQIFYGAPGTGKSHKVKEVTETLPKSDVFRTTFHPDSDYSTFVGCYKPKMVKAPIRDGSGHEITSACEDEKKRIAYEYEPQAFLKAYVRAYETNEPVFLVIEEINRGNCAQIFGDMFQLLDRNEAGESDYAIKPETAIQEFLNEKLKDCVIEDETIKSGEEMRLPANLHIWATMNTSDQSLFPIDSAFKRRWDWKYMPINTQKESWSIKVNGTEYSWSNFIEKINAEIDSVTHSEDKKLGFYFCKAENGVISAERFVSKVLFYIWNDVFKDYGFEKDIFNDTEGKLSFGKFYHDNGEIQEDKVELFLKNLAVEVLDDSNAMVDKFDDSKISNEQVKNERKESLVSVTINGKRFDKSNCSAQFDIYLSALREIGINRVAPLIMNMKYHREGKKMASSTTENLNNSNHLEYIQAGNYYFLKGIKSYTLIRILEDLKPLLDGVDLQIEYK